MNRLFMRLPITFTPKFVVWITTTMRRGDGKRKARAVPLPIAAAIYPVDDVVAGKPFKGWTLQSLIEGRAARWYGAPVRVFDTPMEAAEAAARLRGWFLGTFDSAEIPLPSGDPDEYMPF